jgi:precorrin-2 C20-methyltransferase/precorrin-3B C17-methyltransferase
MSAGRLYGVGVGPGDPELLTLKAQRLIAAADVIAYPVARHGRSVARGIAAEHFRADVTEVAMRYPVTTEATDHPGGYQGALVDFYDESAAALAAQLDAGRDVVVLCEGDPFFYGSYMYLHDRLASRYATTVVAGVTSFSAAAASAGVPLAKRDDVLTILPGTLPVETLTARLADADAAVVMKLGRTFPTVVEAAGRAGVVERSVYVERASSDRERCAPLGDMDDDVPYMSLVLVPTRQAAARGGHRPADERAATPVDAAPAAASAATGGAADGATGGVTVVGLGPAGDEWRTPEAQQALEQADVIVGYQTYVDRVPERAGQRRLASDNRVETDRARHALELATDGARVAVVSSGDPGIFAMAAAVLEVLDDADDALRDVPVRIVPGLSAMQAAAARVGAPLGHDFAVISLSDILKPQEVVERRLDAAAAADLALALYNPASRTRRAQLTSALAVIGRHRGPDTPLIVARAVGSDVERVTVTTLGALDPDVVDMRTLLIVGSSTTTVVDRPGRAPLVYTPRSYADATGGSPVRGAEVAAESA